MQSSLILRRVAPIVLIVAMVFAASCTSSRKYGCPNKLEASSLFGR